MSTQGIRSNSNISIPTSNGSQNFIPDGSISTQKLADLATTTPKLANSANPMPMLSQGFQSFVDTTTNVITATTTTGTPAAGRFYSTVVNRASMPDLSQNLKAHMGVERIMTQNIYQLQNEFGPNGEPVFGVVNDTFGQVRYVGAWANGLGSAGQYPQNNSTSGSYIEITFYGTGLNIFSNCYGTVHSYLISINGNTETSLSTATFSNVLDNRNYSVNQAINIMSNQTLGLYTVRIKSNSGAFNWATTGFEILNESSSVKTNPGIAYINGAKTTLNAQDSTAYNSVVTGTRGGRVVEYLNADGTLGRAFQAVNASQQNLTSADHTNEEVVRTYHWREFGAGRSDDFSNNTNAAKAFTLDDGTTTLAHNSAIVNTASEGLYLNATNDFFTFTFVGTGIDIENVRSDGTTLGSFTVFVDGTSIGTLPADTNIRKKTIKLVSGLPYGSHTVKIRSDAGGNAYFYSKFIVYQPKKPTVPSTAIEIADYNVMADFSALTGATSDINTIATGVLRKASAREFVYVNGTGGTGDWAQITLVPANSTSGHCFGTDRANAYVEYTFFGTGFQYRGNVVSASTTFQVNLNGVAASTTNYPSLTANVYGTGLSYTTSTGVVDFGDATQRGAGFTVSGLPLAKYTVRVTNTTATFMNIESIDIICPIHSTKSNIYADYQNTLTVGSNSLSDSRKVTPLKDVSASKKNWAQAVGISSSPTTTSTSLVPCPDLSVTIKTNGGDLVISYTGQFSNNTLNSSVVCQIYINGTAQGTVKVTQAATAGNAQTLSDNIRVPVASGTNKVDVYWSVDSGTATAILTRRNLKVEEV